MEAALSEVEENIRCKVRDTTTVGAASANSTALAEATHNNANQWADKTKSQIQFGYDADAEAERWWAEHGQKTIGVLARM